MAKIWQFGASILCYDARTYFVPYRLFLEQLNRYEHARAGLFQLELFQGLLKLNTRFAEMVTECHKFGFFGKIKIQFFKKHFSKKI